MALKTTHSKDDNALHDTSGEQLAMDVIQIAKHKDKRAFVRVFEYYAPRLKGFLIKSGLDGGAADEVTQESLMTVWRKAALYNPKKASVSAWVFTICRNKKIDRLRKENKPKPHAGDIAPEPPMEAEKLVEEKQIYQNIHYAMTSLSEDQKSVIELSFFKGMPHCEIAEFLGLPLGTVKSRLRLAQAKMRGVLSEVEL